MVIRLCIAASLATALAACSIHETEYVEIRRCPRMQDTIDIVDWNDVDINVEGL